MNYRLRHVPFFVALSLLLHVLVSWQVMRLVTHYERARYERLLAQHASLIGSVVYLVEPANQIKPDRTDKVGIRHNRILEERVARPRPVGPRPAGRPAGARPAGARPVGPRPAGPRLHGQEKGQMQEPHTLTFPATAIVRQLGGGLMANLPEDYFPNYRHGDHTYINVLRHPSVGYFVEIKQTIGLAWNPLPIARAHIGYLSQRGAMRTVLGITIDKKGDLQEAFVLKGSGVAAYDREALRAFRVSSPFFAPPSDILAMDGLADDMLRLSVSFHMYL